MEEVDPSIVEAYLAHKKNQAARGRGKKLTPEQADVKRKRLWVSIAKKEIPKVGRMILISMFWGRSRG